MTILPYYYANQTKWLDEKYLEIVLLTLMYLIWKRSCFWLFWREDTMSKTDNPN
jgi:hypothetical protein